ncbi:MAG: hypothetical protein ACP5JP_01930 [bacterium]
MRKHIKYIVLAGLFLLSGCINVKENIVLKLNGSGSMHLAYYIPEALMRDQNSLRNAMVQTGITFPLTTKEFNDQFAGLHGVKVKGVKTFNEKGYYIVEGKVEFDNINNVQMHNMHFSLKKTDGNNELVISLINSMNKAQSANAKPGTGYENILKGSLTNYGIKFDVNFPTHVISANGNIDGRDVKWDVPMNVFLKSQAKEMELRAVYSGHPTLWDRIKDFFR